MPNLRDFKRVGLGYERSNGFGGRTWRLYRFRGVWRAELEGVGGARSLVDDCHPKRATMVLLTYEHDRFLYDHWSSRARPSSDHGPRCICASCHKRESAPRGANLPRTSTGQFRSAERRRPS